MKIIIIIAILDILIALFNFFIAISLHSFWNGIVGIFLLGASEWLFFIVYDDTHPQLPSWAKRYFEER